MQCELGCIHFFEFAICSSAELLKYKEGLKCTKCNKWVHLSPSGLVESGTKEQMIAYMVMES